MTTQTGYKVWKVSAKDSSVRECTFDAQLLFHDRIDTPLEVGMGPDANALKTQYFNHPVPFELPLPNRPFTLVVRARGASSMLVAVEDYDADGPTGNGSWCHDSTAIIVHTHPGTMNTSLPDGTN